MATQIQNPKSEIRDAFWLAIWALASRELIRFFRQRTRVIGALGPPVPFSARFGAGVSGSFKPPDWAPREMTYQEYFFPGVAVLIVMFTAIFSTMSIIEDRREGFLQGVLVAPVSRSAIVLGKVLGGTAVATIQACLFVALGPLLGLPLTLQAAVSMVGALFVVGFGLTALGFCIAWGLDSVQGFHAIMMVLLMPMWLLSGAFLPAAGVPAWLGWTMALNPLSYGVALIRHVLYL